MAKASPWEPNPDDRFQKFRLYPEKSAFFCFNPTYDPSVPDGLILYEIHNLDDEVETDPGLHSAPPPLVAIQQVFERIKDSRPVTRDEAFALMNSLRQERWGNDDLDGYDRAWLHNAFFFIFERAINDKAIEIGDVSLRELVKHFNEIMPDIPSVATSPGIVTVPPRGPNDRIKITTPVMRPPAITYNPGQRLPWTGPRISPGVKVNK